LSNQKPLLLASASPRRQELLRKAGINFVARPANIPEVPLRGEQPRVFAERMSREKARAARDNGNGGVILAADTVVAVEAEILGKPEDSEDARRMLRRLSNRTHEVITAVCLLGEEFSDVRSEMTLVHFDPMSEAEIADYVLSGEPMDKAGAYAIQGGASRWTDRIVGEFSNVVGLPLSLVAEMLRANGLLN
jgi:nucleoside triphosphate pyrophosphatase